jgi:hypothetical protein
MKYCSLLVSLLLAASVQAQETPLNSSKRNEYKSVGITYSSYAKPTATSLYNSDFLINDQTYDYLNRNTGFTLKYSQMNFIRNCGIEFGIGAEIMRINTNFYFSLPAYNASRENVELSSIRSNLGFVVIPLYYVHRIELGKGFTLFPKIGVDAKVLITNPRVGNGVYTDSLNNLNYSVGYETTQRYENGPFQNVFLNGTIGTTLTWSMKKGGAFGLNLAFSLQLLRNTLLTRINDITFKREGVVTYESDQLMGDYYYFDDNGVMQYYEGSPAIDFKAANRMTNFSIGVSYLFGK